MPPPVKHTCPDIDKLIHSIRVIGSLSANPERIEDPDDLRDHLNDISSEVFCFEDELEKLRRSNSDLREWGEEMENEKEALEDRVRELEALTPQES